MGVAGAGLAGLASRVSRCTFGGSSHNKSRCFSVTAKPSVLIPISSLPGRFGLATRPDPTGSHPWIFDRVSSPNKSLEGVCASSGLWSQWRGRLATCDSACRRISRQSLARTENRQLWKNAWWARRDSNPQPDRYERSALTIELQARCVLARDSVSAAARRLQHSPYLVRPQNRSTQGRSSTSQVHALRSCFMMSR